MLPWLVWLSGLSASLQTEGLPIRFLVRAHAWVLGLVPGSGMYGRQLIDVSLLYQASLLLFLPPFPFL